MNTTIEWHGALLARAIALLLKAPIFIPGGQSPRTFVHHTCPNPAAQKLSIPRKLTTIYCREAPREYEALSPISSNSIFYAAKPEKARKLWDVTKFFLTQIQEEATNFLQ